MGKYSLTRTVRNDRKRTYSSRSNTFSSVGDYLSEVPRDGSQFQTQAFLYGFDPSGIYRGYLEARDSSNYWNDYFRNTGLSWADVKYPTKMYGFGNSGMVARTAANFVSRNISRLYR